MTLSLPQVISPGASLRRLTSGIAAALVVSGCILIAIIAYIGWAANRHEQLSERSRIENALTQSVVRILDELKSSAWWDDAVEKISNNFDGAFVDANFGFFFTETFSHDEIYILDGQNKPIYGFADGSRLDVAAFQKEKAAFAGVITEARGTPERLGVRRADRFTEKQTAYNFLKGALGPAKWGAKITLVDGKPAIVAAITIVPNVDLNVLKSTPYLLLSVVRIDDAFLAEVGKSLLIPNLRLSQDGSAAENSVAEAFSTDDGQDAGTLVWKTSQPGQPLLTLILPLVLLGVVGMWLLSAKMLRRLSLASLRLAASEASARYDATHDALSGLPNRSLFFLRLTQALNERAEARDGSSLVVGYLDVDRFKDINDTSGHAVGDKLIVAVGARLSQHLGSECFIARFGGDEFALFRHLRAGELHDLGPLVMQAFREPLPTDGTTLKVTVSLGLARSPEHGTDAQELMRHADIALYVAKRNGRDQAVCFDADMAQHLTQKREIEVGLRKALANGGLSLHFQPIVSARSRKIEGVEALLRWTHPTKGPIPPSVFVPVAEESGLMVDLGDWVLREAIACAPRLEGLGVAINLSPAQFRQGNLPALLRNLLHESGVDAARLTFEITEGLLLDRSQDTFATLDAIHALGCRIALDDFGIGFSSLKYLVDFRFDKLKIDRSFVSGLSDAPANQAIVRSVIQLGRALKMEVVAEGVETRFEAALMQAFGCDHMQGYLFSKPVPLDELTAFVQSFNEEAEDAPAGDAGAKQPRRLLQGQN